MKTGYFSINWYLINIVQKYNIKINVNVDTILYQLKQQKSNDKDKYWLKIKYYTEEKNNNKYQVNDKSISAAVWGNLQVELMQYFLRHRAQLSGQTAAIAVKKVKLSGARNRRDAMFIVTSPRSGVRARETESNGAAFNPLSLLWCAGTQLPPQRHRHRTPAAVYCVLHMALRNHPCDTFCGEIENQTVRW